MFYDVIFKKNWCCKLHREWHYTYIVLQIHI